MSTQSSKDVQVREPRRVPGKVQTREQGALKPMWIWPCQRKERAFLPATPKPLPILLLHPISPYCRPGPYTLVQGAAFSTFSLALCAQLSSFLLHLKRLLHVFALPRRLKVKDEICSAAQHFLLIARSNQRIQVARSALRPTAKRRGSSLTSRAIGRQTYRDRHLVASRSTRPPQLPYAILRLSTLSLLEETIQHELHGLKTREVQRWQRCRRSFCPCFDLHLASMSMTPLHENLSLTTPSLDG